jgi:hypothetical protein
VQAPSEFIDVLVEAFDVEDVVEIELVIAPGETELVTVDIEGVVEIELVIAPGEIELVTGHTMAMAGHTVPDWQTGTQ